MTDAHKHCPRCGVRKPLTAFPPAPSRSDGVASLCRPCHRQNMAAVRSTPEGRLATNVAARKYRARAKAKAALAAAIASSLDVAGNPLPS